MEWDIKKYPRKEDMLVFYANINWINGNILL